MQAPKELKQAQDIANLLDMAVKIPFIGVRIGLDFLVGLIPVLGDTIMLLASLRIVQLADKINVPTDIRKLMLRNALLDYGLGFIPIVGDIVDVFYKANIKNVRLMERWWITENKGAVDAHTQALLADWEAH